MAAEDKKRFERECAARDTKFEAAQAARRAARDAPVDGPRVLKAPVVTVPKRAPRAFSDAEQAAQAERKAEKRAKQIEMRKQDKAVDDAVAASAQKRLHYLLCQSDVFSAFGVGNLNASISTPSSSTSSSSSSSSSSSASPSKRQSRGLGPDDEDAENGDGIVATRLLKQPSCIKFGQMRPYQLEGLNWMIKLQEHGVNGILADEMGLGKTLQSISILGFMQEYKGVSGPHLVLVPKSTLANWMNEFSRWCPSLRTVRFHGDREHRQEMVRNVLKPGIPQSEREWDVVVTTYEVCNMEASALAKFAWRYMVIDEAHRIKNEQSKFSQTIRSLKTEHRLLITGTPLQNNLHELWALLNFMLPDVFESSEQFDELFNLQIEDDDAKKGMIGMLHKILRPFMLRRLKADVETSLPPKSEMLIFTSLSAMQKELYKKILRREVDTVNGEQGASKNALMNIVMQLRKACNHPYLFEGQEDRKLDPLGDHLVANCGKMALLDKLLVKLKERGHRVLIFSQMTRMLDIIEDYMMMRQYQYCRIDGDTSYDDREELIDAYNAQDSDKFVFLLSTRAGGLGINLQTADTVVLYDSDWNPQSDLQAQDRAHRIGQKKVVKIYRLVTENTIEEKVVMRAQQKLKLDAMVVQQGRLANKDKLSKEELMDALRFGAEKVFRSGDGGVNDEDIDIILDRGKKRTEELMGKLENAEKGDLLDFKMDGGMKAQEFEGRDYSAERRSNAPVIDKMLLLEEECAQQRVRKPVANYNEKNFYVRGESQDRPKKPKKARSKLPDSLRIPHMHAWQFFQHERLNQIVTEEERSFLIRANSNRAGEVLPENSMVTSAMLVGDTVAAEKNTLLNEGFPNWQRAHFNAFVRGCFKYGRDDVDAIANDVGIPLEEVIRYKEAFWAKGPAVFGVSDWARMTRNIEKGEKKLLELKQLALATKGFVERFKNPWQDLSLNYGQGRPQSKEFTAVEDRCLLCLAHTHGFGNWEKIRQELHRINAAMPEIQLDYLLLSATTESIGKRCEWLMNLCLKDATAKKVQGEKVAGDAECTAEEKSKLDARVIEAEHLRQASIELSTKKIEQHHYKVRIARKIRTKLNANPVSNKAACEKEAVKAGLSDGSSSAKAANLGGPRKRGRMHGMIEKDGKKKKAALKGDEDSIIAVGLDGFGGRFGDFGSGCNGVGVGSGASSVGNASKKSFPGHLLPTMEKLVLESKTWGVEKLVESLVEKFKDKHTISKRQLKLTLDGNFVKEVRHPSVVPLWYRRTQEDLAARSEAEAAGLPMPISISGAKSVGKKKPKGASNGKNESEKVTPDSASLTIRRATSGGVPDYREDNANHSHKKRKIEGATSGGGSKGISQEGPPKKPRAAFTIFCVDERADAKRALKERNNGHYEPDALAEECKKRWSELSTDRQTHFESKAKIEKLRFQRELKAFNEKQQGLKREEDRIKKVKKKTKHSEDAMASGPSSNLNPSQKAGMGFAIPIKKAQGAARDVAYTSSIGAASSPTSSPMIHKKNIASSSQSLNSTSTMTSGCALKNSAPTPPSASAAASTQWWE